MARYKYSEDINSSLLQVVTIGKVGLTRKLLLRGATIDSTWNEEGYNALHVAVREGHLRIVQVMINFHVNLYTPTKDGYPPLLLAVINQRDDIVATLAKAGAKINDGNRDNFTALHAAAEFGYERIVKILIKLDADVNVATNEGVTPLHLSVMHNGATIVEKLLKSGADVNQQDNMRESALHHAVSKGRNDIVSLLLRYKADVNMTDVEGFTAFHMASALGHTEIVDLLLQGGADINKQSQTLYTPLMEAVTNRHSEIALRLLYNGANLHLANLNGDTAVILAAETDAVSVLNMLITSCGADIFDTNDDGFTPFLTAAYHGSNEALEYLLSITPSKHAFTMVTAVTPRQQRTALHWAVIGNHVSTVSILLTNLPWQTLCAQDVNGATALFLAAEIGSLPLVRIMIDFCGPIDIPNHEGLTPEMVASLHDHYSVADYLYKISKNKGRSIFCKLFITLDQLVASFPTPKSLGFTSDSPLNRHLYPEKDSTLVGSGDSGGWISDSLAVSSLSQLPLSPSSHVYEKIADSDHMQSESMSPRSQQREVVESSSVLHTCTTDSKDEIVTETDFSGSVLRLVDLSVAMDHQILGPVLSSLDSQSKDQVEPVVCSSQEIEPAEPSSLSPIIHVSSSPSDTTHWEKVTVEMKDPTKVEGIEYDVVLAKSNMILRVDVISPEDAEKEDEEDLVVSLTTSSYVLDSGRSQPQSNSDGFVNSSFGSIIYHDDPTIRDQIESKVEEGDGTLHDSDSNGTVTADNAIGDSAAAEKETVIVVRNAATQKLDNEEMTSAVLSMTDHATICDQVDTKLQAIYSPWDNSPASPSSVSSSAKSVSSFADSDTVDSTTADSLTRQLRHLHEEEHHRYENEQQIQRLQAHIDHLQTLLPLHLCPSHNHDANTSNTVDAARINNLKDNAINNTATISLNSSSLLSTMETWFQNVSRQWQQSPELMQEQWLKICDISPLMQTISRNLSRNNSSSHNNGNNIYLTHHTLPSANHPTTFPTFSPGHLPIGVLTFSDYVILTTLCSLIMISSASLFLFLIMIRSRSYTN